MAIKKCHPFLLVERGFAFGIMRIVGFAPNDDYSASLRVHTLEQKNRQQPVTKIVGRKCHVKAVSSPCLRQELEVAGIQHQSPDRGDLACCHTLVDPSSCRANSIEVRQLKGYHVVGVRAGELSSLECRLQSRSRVCISCSINAVIGRRLGPRQKAGNECATETTVGTRDKDGALCRLRCGLNCPL